MSANIVNSEGVNPQVVQNQPVTVFGRMWGTNSPDASLGEKVLLAARRIFAVAGYVLASLASLGILPIVDIVQYFRSRAATNNKVEPAEVMPPKPKADDPMLQILVDNVNCTQFLTEDSRTFESMKGVLSPKIASFSVKDKEIYDALEKLEVEYQASIAGEIVVVAPVSDVNKANINAFFKIAVSAVKIEDENELFRLSGKSDVMDTFQEKLLGSESELTPPEIGDLTSDLRENDYCGLIKRFVRNTLSGDVDAERFPQLAKFVVDVQKKSQMVTPKKFLLAFKAAAPFFQLETAQ